MKTSPTAEQYHRALDRAILIVVGQNRQDIFDPTNNLWPEIDEGLKLLAARPDLPTTVTLIDLMKVRGIERMESANSFSFSSWTVDAKL